MSKPLRHQTATFAHMMGGINFSKYSQTKGLMKKNDSMVFWITPCNSEGRTIEINQPGDKGKEERTSVEEPV